MALNLRAMADAPGNPFLSTLATRVEPFYINVSLTTSTAHAFDAMQAIGKKRIAPTTTTMTMMTMMMG